MAPKARRLTAFEGAGRQLSVTPGATPHQQQPQNLPRSRPALPPRSLAELNPSSFPPSFPPRGIAPPSAPTAFPFPGMGVLIKSEAVATPPATPNIIVKPEAAVPPPPVVRTPPATQYNSIVVTAQQKSPFFKLSAELRIVIYRLVVISQTPIQIKRCPFAAEPNLLFTCKQIRKEAQLMFWVENSFQGRDAVYVCNSRTKPPQVLYQRQLSVLLEWLDRIGFEKAGLVKKLQVDYDEDCQFNGHPAYESNWPATAEEVMKQKKRDLAAAARYSAIKILRGLLFHGVPLNAVKPVPILKGMLRDGQGDQFGALWKLAMEEVIGVLMIQRLPTSER